MRSVCNVSHPEPSVQGLAMQRILELMAEDHKEVASMDFDFVLVAGHFLMRDENIFTYFEGMGVKIDHHSELPRFASNPSGVVSGGSVHRLRTSQVAIARKSCCRHSICVH